MHKLTYIEKVEIKKSSRRPWLKDEIKLLKKLFPSGGAREIAMRTGHPLAAVRQKAYDMGITTREYHRRLWSADETELLKRLYPNESIRNIADKLGRSEQEVYGKAHTIGLKKEKYRPWSKQELMLLQKMYSDNSPQDIANKLGRTVSAAIKRACQLGFSKKPRVWSKRELNLLKRLYPNRTAQQIADQIGRPVQATRKRIVILGLKKRLGYEGRHRVVNGAKEKLCRKCRKWRGESQFNKNRNSKDGLNIQCRDCVRAYDRKRYERIRKAGIKNIQYKNRHRVVNGIKQKFCRTCKRWKDESAFYKDSSRKDGLNNQCKKCSCKTTSKSRKRRLVSA